jgi:hypothetical protein
VELLKRQKIFKDRAMSHTLYSFIFYRIKPEIEQCQGQGIVKGQRKIKDRTMSRYIFEYIFYRLSLGLNNEDRALLKEREISRIEQCQVYTFDRKNPCEG